MINFRDLAHRPYENPNCRDTPKEVFFPALFRGDWRPYREAVAAAQAICQGCPEQLRCYSDARARREAFGIWGGVNFSARQTRKQPETQCPTTMTPPSRSPGATRSSRTAP